MASNPPFVSKPGLFVTLVTKAVFTVTNISVTIVRCYNSDLQAFKIFNSNFCPVQLLHDYLNKKRKQLMYAIRTNTELMFQI